MTTIERKNHTINENRFLEVITGRPIIGFFRCPKCKTFSSVRINSIYSDGRSNIPMQCSRGEACGFKDYIKLIDYYGSEIYA